jgi:SAM-dependent methyltransferase
MLALNDFHRGAPALLRSTCGRTIELDVARWISQVAPEESRLLEEARGPALDVGCGPGRITLALQRRGVDALGIDIDGRPVVAARRRGACVIRRDVFEPLPREGRWASALLVDGNVGIGGDPVALLRRIRSILRPNGRVLVEAARPGTPGRRLTVRAEVDGLRRSGWFPWAVVSIDELDGLARASSLALDDVWSAGGRWFARLGTE